MQRRPVLLLELMISLALFGTIMVFLLSSYKDLTLTKKFLHDEKEKIFGRQRVQLRLTQVFSRLKETKIEKGRYLLTYDNGADPEEQFRGEVKGMFYLDGKRLCLITYPKSGVERKEILMTGIDDFILRFFDAKKAEWDPLFPEKKTFMAKLTLIIKNDQVELPLLL
jgi:hypothetical protein